MAKDLLLVIDVQNAYMEGQPWACRDTGEMVKNIRKLLDSGKEMDVIFTQFLAPEDPQGNWKAYNEINAEINASEELNAIVDDLVPYLEKYPLAVKSTYSSMKNVQVREAALKAERVVVTGVVADCCVLATAMEAIDLGCPLVYLKDAVAGLNRETEAATELVLSGLDYVQTTLMTVDEYLTE